MIKLSTPNYLSNSLNKAVRIIIICLVISNNCFCQWKVLGINENRTIAYDFVIKSGLSQTQHGKYFFGLANSPAENIKAGGITPLTKNSLGLSNVKTTLTWLTKLTSQNNISINEDLYLFINLFTNNIKKYTIYLQLDSLNWFQKDFYIEQQGFQVPFEFPLSSMIQNAPLNVNKSVHPINNITQLVIGADLISDKSPYEFLIGSFQIDLKTINQVPAKGEFFYKLTNDTLYKQNKLVLRSFGSEYPIKQFCSFTNFMPSNYTLIPDSLKYPKLNFEKATLEVIKSLIAYYPYYSEHNIKRDSVLQKVNNVINYKNTFKLQVDSLKSIIQGLHDGHFYIEELNKENHFIPLVAKKINDQIQIIGIFDKDLAIKLKPGTVITAINNQLITKYIDSTSQTFYGDINQRRNLAISNLFNRNKKDSLIITYMSELQKEQSLTIHFNKKPDIPLNFRPKHFKYNSISKDWSYVKFNRWEIGDWVRFYNISDSIKAKKGIIIDLRGNPGGAEIEAIRVLSCFIDNPIVFSVSSCYGFDSLKIIDQQNIVIPNQFVNLSDKKLIVLEDSNTACASELFIQTLKKRNLNTIVIGNERTSGTYAPGVFIYLPFNLVLRTNSLSKLSSNELKSSIEFKGINPDVVVNFQSYLDLAPYNDKVLTSAIKYSEALF